MKTEKLKIFIPITLGIILISVACSKNYLDVNGNGLLSPQLVANQRGVEALLVGAYSLLDGEGSSAGTNNGPWATAASNWVYGSVAGGDAHKGSDPGDQNLITPIEQWNATSQNAYLENLWEQRYDGVQRANDVLRVMRLAKDIAPADTIRISAEARFLRAHYHFEVRKIFGHVPWIPENITYSAGNANVPNTEEILPQIEADFSYAMSNLPGTAAAAGRVNKWAAASYLAKAYMFDKKFAEALTLLKDIIANGTTASGVKYGLNDHFYDNFNPATKNSKESVFAVQNFVNDGTGGSNGNTGDALNAPYGGGAQTTCCGFFQPSFSLANSYKVDDSGLPFLDGSYNNKDLKNDQGLKSSDPYTPDTTTPLDPRIDWTIGRRGVPFLDWGIMAGAAWVRDQGTAGPYEPVKNLFLKSQVGSLTDASGWTPAFSANNVNLIRFSDVLLWAAEAAAQGGDLSGAMGYVNMVRDRMKDHKDGWVQGSGMNYQIGDYKSFPSKEYALKAIYFERKLELAMEGHRFFDLVRWGVAASELGAYQTHEANSGYYAMKGGVSFTTGKSEYLPIPDQQIQRSKVNGTPVLTQNPGY